MNHCPPLLDFIVDKLGVGILVVDADMRIVVWNRFMALHSGHAAEEILGRDLFQCFPELPAKWLEKKIRSVFVLRNYAFTSWEQRPYLFRFHHNRPVTGGIEAMQQSCTFLPVKDAADEVTHVCITLFDYTDTALYQRQLAQLIDELRREREEQGRLIAKLDSAQSQLLQSEKLAAIGQLAAGVAHEINNPIGFINSNVCTLDRYVRDLMRLIDAYSRAERVLAADPAALAAIEVIKRDVGIDFLVEDLPSLIAESKDGLDRVKKIVQDLKDFSRDGGETWERADVHRCLDSTLNVVANELKYKAGIVKKYAVLPDVECVPSQLNQVFMNLLVNAAQAIPERGTITIATELDGDWVWVAISDTGCGIAPEHLKRIFDPFYTTKPVGKGTGLGLSVSHNIVTRHGGRFDVETEIGKGTTFRVWLPIAQEKRKAA